MIVYFIYMKGVEEVMTLEQKIEERGIEKGIERGMERGIAQIIVKMIEHGLSVDEISQYTGMDSSVIMSLLSEDE